MRIVLNTILGSILAAGAIAAGIADPAYAQTVKPPLLPASAPASAPLPVTATSRPIQGQSPAVRAAESAKEPGNQRPEERVIPQISVPFKGRNSAANAPPAAPLPPGTVPGRVNEGAARCLAIGGAAEKAACERGLASAAAASAAAAK